MAEVHLQTIFQVKRGYSSAWERVNPILRVGEPGFAIDTNILKIGNGETPWNDLKSINGGGFQEIVSAPTVSNFPAVGSVNFIYRASEEGVLYQWDSNLQKYTRLNDIGEIKLIHGGNANGN